MGLTLVQMSVAHGATTTPEFQVGATATIVSATVSSLGRVLVSVMPPRQAGLLAPSLSVLALPAVSAQAAALAGASSALAAGKLSTSVLQALLEASGASEGALQLLAVNSGTNVQIVALSSANEATADVQTPDSGLLVTLNFN